MHNAKPKPPPVISTSKLGFGAQVKVKPAASELEWDGTPRYARRYKDLVTRHWCTPACIAGLKYGHAMDASCPNAALHCVVAGCTDHSKHGHPRSLAQVRSEMVEAMASIPGMQGVYQVMEPILHCNGVRAQLFRFLHPELGYAFAAKGVHVFYANLLRKENAMLESIHRQTSQQANSQNKGFPMIGEFFYGRGSVRVHVPIACGVVDRLAYDNPYPFYPGNKQLGGASEQTCNGWLLLSYHSLSLNRTRSLRSLTQKLGVEHGEAKRMLAELGQWCRQRLADKGIEHGDLHTGNLLWCNHLDSLVIIDFERALWY